MKQTTEKTWKRYWDHHPADTIAGWDWISQDIFSVLLKELGEVTGKKILETGSGTGRISLRLAQAGASVTLLDIATKAASMSRRLFLRHRMPGQFVVGTLFKLPFSQSSYDCVWSGGVLEHFTPAEQRDALVASTRVTKKGGKVIVFVPSSRAIFYRAGKLIREKVGVWDAGYEAPQATLANIAPSNLQLQREYQIGFWTQLAFLYPLWLELIVKAPFLFLNGRQNPRWLIRLFGGYLLVSVFEKQ